MTTLFDAINQSGTTANGAVTNLSSLDKVLDLFFLIGASRGKDISHAFIGAMVSDQDLAVRTLLWARDVRGGAGERDTFRKLFVKLAQYRPELAVRVLARIPDLGRWDDVLSAIDTPVEDTAVEMIRVALVEKHDGLAAKWMPRQGVVAGKLRAKLGYTPKAWRKLLVGLSATVEQKMCAGEWTKINYEQVPSVAASRYQRAFGKHDPAGYGEYCTKLKTGEAKIHASVLYPYDVIRSLRDGSASASDAQWAALPNYLEGNTSNIMPLVDVSGSMDISVSGSVTAMDVAVSLGLYISERTEGVFKDTFMTFSSNPTMVKVSGTLSERCGQMINSEWGGSTNLEGAFKTLLAAAVKHSVPVEQMPATILIMSDMEFNVAVGMPNASLFENIKAKYAAAGYAMPNLVFWNIAGRAGNVPVRRGTAGVALVSGASPSILKSVLSGTAISPEVVMRETVMVDRYNY